MGRQEAQVVDAVAPVGREDFLERVVDAVAPVGRADFLERVVDYRERGEVVPWILLRVCLALHPKTPSHKHAPDDKVPLALFGLQPPTAFTPEPVRRRVAGHRRCGAGRDSRTRRQCYFAIIVVLRPHESETAAFLLFTQSSKLRSCDNLIL